uniref:POP5-like protein, ribonuclease P/MRP subunit n=1 Tax=Myotis myotis TaxID=51298 RepID=A0A7J7S2J1_MYOMY|nr:POP5-like protein, ribonuclease P/MRP subunit [Myotis myotis]
MVRFKHRYLLCEVVSDDPRCRLSLDDRVLGGLVRDTVARLHGTFGAAACSIGFAGTKMLGNPEGLGAGGGRRRTSGPRSCQVWCTIHEVFFVLIYLLFREGEGETSVMRTGCVLHAPYWGLTGPPGS